MASCTQPMRYSKPQIGLHVRICGLLIRCAPFGDNFELAESVAGCYSQGSMLECYGQLQGATEKGLTN